MQNIYELILIFIYMYTVQYEWELKYPVVYRLCLIQRVNNVLYTPTHVDCDLFERAIV